MSREAAFKASSISIAFVGGGALAALAAFAERAVLGREAVFGASVELIVSGLSMRGGVRSGSGSEFGDQADDLDVAEPHSVSALPVLVHDHQGVAVDGLEGALHPLRSVDRLVRRHADAAAGEAAAVVERVELPVEAGGLDLEEDIRRIGQLKDGEDAIGNQTRVKVVKNKVAPPFRKAEFDIMFGEGISKTGEILDLGVEYGIVKKSGSWFSYGDTKLAQGRDASKNVIRDNPDLAAELEAKIVEAIKEAKN